MDTFFFRVCIFRRGILIRLFSTSSRKSSRKWKSSNRAHVREKRELAVDPSFTEMISDKPDLSREREKARWKYNGSNRYYFFYYRVSSTPGHVTTTWRRLPGDTWMSHVLRMYTCIYLGTDACIYFYFIYVYTWIYFYFIYLYVHESL